MGRTTAREAIAILEPLGPSAELARAYSGLSALSVVAQDVEETILWGERALEMATQLGDERTRAHALVNLGTVAVHLDPNATEALVEAHAVADAAGDPFEAARAFSNLAGVLGYWVRPGPAMHFAEQAIAYAQEHDVQAIASYAGTIALWLRLRSGAWDEAERAIRSEIASGTSVAQLLGEISLTELAVRRGDATAPVLLGELTDRAKRTGELQRIIPTVELAIELALTTDAPMPLERLAAVVEMAETRGGLTGWDVVRVPAWAAVAGVTLECNAKPALPFSAMIARDWRVAADSFGVVGWSYDRALMLSLLDERDALDEAHTIAQGLGAKPLLRRVARRRETLAAPTP
jgi:hypothetical protein